MISGGAPGGSQTIITWLKEALLRHSKPKFRHILHLKCPRCGITPLQEKGCWFKFREGCPKCDYSYDREPGYFWGAAWIISYTAASLAAFAVAIPLLIYYPEVDGLFIAAAAVTPILPVVGLMHPYSRAAWMWFDHYFHPLSDYEHLGQPLA